MPTAPPSNHPLPRLPFTVRTLYAKGDSLDSSPDDLAFHENELIRVISLGDGNWWKGTMFRNRTTGYFPKNYVEIIQDENGETASHLSGKEKDTREQQQEQQQPGLDFSFQSSRNYYREDPTDPYAPPGPYSSSSGSGSSFNDASQRSQTNHRATMKGSAQFYGQTNGHQQQHQLHQSRQHHTHSHHQTSHIQRSHHNPRATTSNALKPTPPPPPSHNVTPSKHTPSPPPSNSSAHYQSPINQSRVNGKVNSPNVYHSPLGKSAAYQQHSQAQMESPSYRHQQFRGNTSAVSLNQNGSDSHLPTIASNINTTLHFSSPHNSSSQVNLNGYPTPPLSKQTTGLNIAGDLCIPYTAGDSFLQSTNITTPHQDPTNQSTNCTHSQGSYFQNSLSSNSSSAMFGMSDFSATSAGSFSRHRYEEQLRLSQLNSSASGNNLLVDERKVKNGRGFMRRFFGGPGTATHGDGVPNLPFSLITGDKQENNANAEMELWVRSKVDLHRSATLTIQERKLRERRIRETESEVILEPHKGISKFNENEVTFGDDMNAKLLDLDLIDFANVDSVVESLDFDDINRAFRQGQVVGVEGVLRMLGRFRTRIEYVRAFFMFCCLYFDVSIDPGVVIQPEEELEVTKEEIARLLIIRKVDSLGMAMVLKSLIDLLKLPCEVIPGVLKLPTIPIRHCWNAILISGEWRMIEAFTPNVHNIHTKEFISDFYTQGANYSDFYFLTQPLHFIHTHVPTSYEHQHINPPVNERIANQLPPCFPAFFNSGLEISRFNNSLTRLQDDEIVELDLKVPNDIEINTTVLTPSGPHDSHSLTQFYWVNDQRHCKIKALLPPNSSTGFINIYAGVKGVQLTTVNPHALAMVIPVTHQGEFSKFEFMSRVPHYSNSPNTDLYVKQPQCRKLVFGSDYIFTILSRSLASNVSSLGSDRILVAIQSPSSRVTRMDVKRINNNEGNKEGYIHWESKVRCDEVGVWRALVSVESGSGLCVFAEWSCER